MPDSATRALPLLTTRCTRWELAKKQNTLLCLDANSGQELWATEVGPFLENGWGGGPRSTPSVDGDYVYTFSGQGHLACLEKANGKTKWNVDVKTLGGKIPKWGYSESVLIDGDKILCTPRCR